MIYRNSQFSTNDTGESLWKCGQPGHFIPNLAALLLALRLTEMGVNQDSVISRKEYAFSELRRSFAGYQYRVTDGGYFVGTGDQNSTTEPTAT